MGRHKKAKADRKSTDLRIPLTAAQKDRILQAAKVKGADMATWARPIVLDAAEEVLCQPGAGGEGEK